MAASLAAGSNCSANHTASDLQTGHAMPPEDLYSPPCGLRPTPAHMCVSFARQKCLESSRERERVSSPPKWTISRVSRTRARSEQVDVGVPEHARSSEVSRDSSSQLKIQRNSKSLSLDAACGTAGALRACACPVQDGARVSFVPSSLEVSFLHSLSLRFETRNGEFSKRTRAVAFRRNSLDRITLESSTRTSQPPPPTPRRRQKPNL